MALHTALRTLVNRSGMRVLDSAHELHATLEDFLEEGQATPGQIAVLTDAVRLDAFQHMLSMLAQGADPQVAVGAAGARLAETRGGDQRTSAWACAALGYAVDRVPEAVVLSYITQLPGNATSATNWPANPSGEMVPPPTNCGFDRGVHPAQTVAPQHDPRIPVQPVPHRWPPGGPADGDAPWQEAPVTPRRTRRKLLIASGAVVTAAALLVAIAVVTTRGEKPGTSAVSDSPPVDPDFSVVELGDKYSALGVDIAAGADSCERQEPQEDQAELVTCSYAHLDVSFTTHNSEGALDQARAEIEEQAAAADYDVNESNPSDTGRFHLVSDDSLDTTWMYWDSTSALQSGYITDTTDELPTQVANAFFDQRHAEDATRVFPDPIPPFESPALWEMAQYYVGDQVTGSSVTDCRTGKEYPGDTEAVVCFDGDYRVHFYVKSSRITFGKERAIYEQYALSNEPWNWFQRLGLEHEYPVSGRLLTYLHHDDGDATVFWNNDALLITGFIFGPSPMISPVEAYWRNGE